ncbi:MAG: NADH-quinone oxidoreductase subunit J [Magnetococcales bacterium]|nr:NADH-quinone oxidoreductase subunit J [Magnetococcales bacterium]
MLVELIFYLFAAITVGAASMVVISKNQVHSVLFLVLTFFSTACLFVLIQAEFLAAILVMVYMGAVAVLFLFVVMMIDLDFAELRKNTYEHLPLGIAVGGVMLVEMVAIGVTYHAPEHLAVATPTPEGVHNTLALGRVLYSKYLLPFEMASLILLVALIGAVVLTLRSRKDRKRQDIGKQLARTRDEAVEVKKVKSWEGA